MTSVADLASPNANRVMLIVPTYNEALNLPLLIPRILAIRDDIDVLVVDDGSPDGTGPLAEELARTFAPRVRVLHRATKSGRGGAVMAGFRQAMADDRYAWFGEMDADQSHQPEELPAFLEAIRDADLVVGARDVPGGRIEGWGLGRKVWSRMSNRIIRLVLAVPLTDLTNGYRVYSRRAVEHLAGAELRETGFISLSEWAYRPAQGRHAHDPGPDAFHQPAAGEVQHVRQRGDRRAARPASIARPHAAAV